MNQSFFPWRREWLPTPVLWPGEFHGQRSLAGYIPWGHKEVDIIEQLSLSGGGEEEIQNKTGTFTIIFIS